jgi:hypothetical protein
MCVCVFARAFRSLFNESALNAIAPAKHFQQIAAGWPNRYQTLVTREEIPGMHTGAVTSICFLIGFSTCTTL